MAAPGSDGSLAFTELVMVLPPDWPLHDPTGQWPLKLMQETAEFPHRFDTWLYCGHTIPNGDPPQPYAPDVGFSGVVLATPLLVPDAFDVAVVQERTVRFQSLIPLFADEMELKLTRGVEALFDRLTAAGVSEGLQTTRRSTAG